MPLLAALAQTCGGGCGMRSRLSPRAIGGHEEAVERDVDGMHWLGNFWADVFGAYGAPAAQ